jgi:hypothetical protein
MQQASSRRESNITSVARTITETRRAARKCARKIRLQRGSALSRTKCIPFTEQFWVQKCFARAPSSQHWTITSGGAVSEGGAALAFEDSWHDAPNTTESSGDNASTLQMIDMMVGHKILQACGRAYVQPLRNRDGRWKRGYVERGLINGSFSLFA